MQGDSISLIWKGEEKTMWDEAAFDLPREFSEVYKNDVTGLVMWRGISIGTMIDMVLSDTGKNLNDEESIELKSFVWALLRSFLGLSKLRVRVFNDKAVERVLGQIQEEKGTPYLSEQQLATLANEVKDLWPAVDKLIDLKILQPRTEAGIYWFCDRPIMRIQTAPTRHLATFFDQGKPEFEPADKPRGFPFSWSSDVRTIPLGKPVDEFSDLVRGHVGLKTGLPMMRIENSEFNALLRHYFRYLERSEIAQIPDPALLGRALYELKLADVRNDLEDAELQEDMWVRLVLSYSDKTPDVAKAAQLPWELLHDGHGFLSTSRGFTLVRRLNLGLKIKPRSIAYPRPLRVAVVAGVTQRDAHVLNDDEVCLRNLEKRFVDIEIVRFEPKSLYELESLLKGDFFHAVHLFGHRHDNEVSAGMPLKSETGELHVNPSDWADLLAGVRPQLVVVNSCGFHRPGAKAYGGEEADMATALVKKGLPAVMVMQTDVADHTVFELVSTFYHLAFAGYPFDVALAEARSIVYHLPETRLGWAAPVLYLQKDEFAQFRIKIGDDWRPPFLKPK